ncbi:hypothetical protein A0U40_15335 [[Bacillus] sp. KCTC 13219]|uniref:hypothetical protein n=1 Tax=Metasolibacillus fluoroglycofenilyticus TaxID=1239396 RepID=UPI000794E8AF|nr:hypothetical protein [Metasolibacillus fluoroglycofenilyticus]KYG91330.1 hypothetical protein A0U40_15335 [[Bacillus] sp. KCTC 13219]
MARTTFLFSSTILTILFTIHTFWRHLFGFSTLDSINRLPLLFSPASYVYLYWLAVFIGLIIYSLRKRHQTSIQLSLLLLAYIFLISFFVSWHAEHHIIALLLLMIQLLSLFMLYRTYSLKRKPRQERVAISLFFGWMLFLTYVFFSYTMVYNNWHGLGLSNALWAVILLTIGAAMALHFRYRYFDRLLPSIFIWGYLGIAWHNGFEELFVTAAALFLSAVLVASLIFSKSKNN